MIIIVAYKNKNVVDLDLSLVALHKNFYYHKEFWTLKQITVWEIGPKTNSELWLRGLFNAYQ